MLKTEFEKALDATADLYTVSYSELSESDVRNNTVLANICEQACTNYKKKSTPHTYLLTLILSLLMYIMGIGISVFVFVLLLSNIANEIALLILSIAICSLLPGYFIYLIVKDILGYKVFLKTYNEPARVLRFNEASIDAIAALLHFYTKFDVFSEDTTLPDIYAIIHPGFKPILINACDCEQEDLL